MFEVMLLAVEVPRMQSFFGIKLYIYIRLVLPGKLTWNPKTLGLEDDFLFSFRGDFQLPAVSFQG